MVDQTSEQDKKRNDLPLGVCVYRICQLQILYGLQLISSALVGLCDDCKKMHGERVKIGANSLICTF
jgi:hypothetical protein